MMENQFEYPTASPFVKKNAAYFRARARDLLRGKWWTAILLGFLAILLGGTLAGGLDPNFNVDLSDVNNLESESVSPLVDWISLETVQRVLAIALLAAAVTTVAYALLVASPVKLGYQRVNLDLVDGEPLVAKKLFSYFKIGYLRSIRLNLLYWIVTSLVVIVPTVIAVILSIGLLQEFMIMPIDAETVGAELLSLLQSYLLPIGVALLILTAACILSLVLSYTYRFSYMVMAEYPHVGAVEAMRISRNMMRGNKWRLFCLDISFIGWGILSAALTFGLGTFVLLPYREAAMAAFYDDLAHRSAAKETEFPSLNFDDYADEATETEASSGEMDEEEAPIKEPIGGFMPFTAELEFPSLDLDDYVEESDADKKE